MAGRHEYLVELEWTGARGVGTTGVRSYGRDGTLRAAGRPDVAVSADRVFHGDRDRWNPEQLLIGALAECHQLSFLFSAREAGIVVTRYEDAATATLEVDASGAGRIVGAVLRPRVEVDDVAALGRLDAVHEAAASRCFIAASVAFPVRIEPSASSS